MFQNEWQRDTCRGGAVFGITSSTLALCVVMITRISVQSVLEDQTELLTAVLAPLTK